MISDRDAADRFEHYCALWGLELDGAPFETAAARLWPVRWRGQAAMLKLNDAAEERRGAAVLAWWQGVGAVRIFASDAQGLLMERAAGARRLDDLARSGRDDEAVAALCATAAKLHTPRDDRPANLIPLSRWFGALIEAEGQADVLAARAAASARSLLATPCEERVLHGDLHHGNVLDFGSRGWCAIDPKGLWGERGFDFAPLFANPDLADPERPVAAERFSLRVRAVSELAGVDPTRLLEWILAWSGLSATWSQDDPVSAKIAWDIASLAARALDSAAR